MRKRPCRFCRRWFAPDRRVGARQRACSVEACQKKRRAATQAGWRAAHPEYRIQRQIERREKEQERELLPVRSPLNQLPWEIAQEEFDRRGADFLAFFGQVLLGCAQDQSMVEVIDSAGPPRRHPGFGVQDQRSP